MRPTSLLRTRLFARFAVTLLLTAAVAAPSAGQDVLADFEEKTSVHVLDNGWTFIIVERPVAPVFSFATVVDVGGAQEVPGITGLAHMFEHMAFKGTPNIGTTDYEAEKKALEEVETAYIAYERARRDPHADAAEVERLHAAFKEKEEAAGEYIVANEFGDIVEREGGVGLNAFTNSDHTAYAYSLPANRVELFAFLESERFLHPVFREFYKERGVVQEERRMRAESQPIGRLIEQLLATAYIAHPYKQPVVGYMSDLQSFTATDAEAFYRKHYVPANMVTVVVGHVSAEKILPTIEKYFGRLPAGEKPETLRTVEPPQIAEKTVVLVDPSQPVYAETYHQPNILDPDQAVYKAIDDVLSNGRTSRLYRSLVRDKKIAAFSGSFSGFPGNKYPGLWLAFAVPAKDHTNEEVQAAIREELERLKTEPVSDGELKRFRTRAKADLLRQVRSNFGLAVQLGMYQSWYGDWREFFRDLDRIEKVTKEDIMRVATKTLTATNRTVGMIVTEEPGSGGETDAGDAE
ncbi:MAG: insulinase family protein [bacterium]|nr:insulinase family protein [bacterium]